MSESRVAELAELITQARHDYYNGQPKVSDQTFDAWFDELSKLDPNNSAITSIGAEPVSEWKKIQHEIHMTSLRKVNNHEQLNKWAEDCEVSSGFLLTEKLDGLSINITYKNGKLIKAATRGNGLIGDDITPNVLKMSGFPNDVSGFSGHIRGEIVLLKSTHNKNFSDYNSPLRNIANGIARRYSGEGAGFLNIFFYSVVGKDFNTEKEQFDWLKNNNFDVPYYEEFKSINDVVSKYNEYSKSIRDGLDYEIDGLVVRINDLYAQYSLGERQSRPVGAIAFKFDAPRATSVLRKIVDNVGGSGQISPVGWFDTVQIQDSNVQKASLYNYGYIEELKIDIGAEILVSKANDIIPRIEEVIKSTNSVYKAPKNCPACDSELSFNGEHLFCLNKAGCPAQKLGRIKTWVSALNILEWGEKVIQRALDAGVVEDVGDLYRVTVDQLMSLDRMGQKSSEKLVSIMEQHKEVPLEVFIGGLSINGISTSMAKMVVDAGHSSLNDILSLSAEDVENIKGFGSIKANLLVSGLKDNKDRIEDILSSGVIIKERAGGALSGLSFCFTGSMSSPKALLQKKVEEAGGESKKGVSKNLDYLVMADPSSTSAKAKAARKNGTKLISEEDFLEMVDK